MVNKGFYDTFTATKQLILDKLEFINKKYQEYCNCPDSDEYKGFQASYAEDLKKWNKILREHTVNFIIKQVGLIHEEGGEGSSAVREGNKKDDKLTDQSGIGCELADVLIRAFDLAGFMGIDLGAILVAKTRSMPPQARGIWTFALKRVIHMVSIRLRHVSLPEEYTRVIRSGNCTSLPTKVS
jgi:NTP pyrophosphatase (non-canonical NTP hydrolase)